ncbi:glycerol kinase [Catalinimonas sp. 4WD22]|uniref:glycerol kinase n=1 Tax=Catalinimonas locisalis TaxID=3133978 RepID=UPI0031011C76
MKKISTTSLAKKINIDVSELFNILSTKKWMFKSDGQWRLTKEGRMVGGEINYNPKFGEYVVWPIDLDLNKDIDYGNTYNATKIGEHFNVSSQKLNLYFSELGWIEKSKGGWVVTYLGKQNGAIQMEAQNGKPYVVWNENIINNKHLIHEIKGATGDETYQKEEAEFKDSDDFRKKFPANLRTPDGHYVRSRAEILIDDFLYKNGIVHAYERKLNIDEEMYCDFYIPKEKIYIEYWGLEENQKYLDRKKKKLDLYAKYKFNLIELSESDIENLDEKLATKLRQHNIIVD